MKSILLIGLGNFGKHIALQLNQLGHQVMAVDHLPIVENAHILRNILYAGVWSKFTEKKKK